MTISVLPDDALLEIFKFYVDQSYREDAWHTLVHVCRKWRYLVFGSPRWLHLKLRCTNRSPVKKMLDVWPRLPIFVDASFTDPFLSNVIAALEEHDRVRRINIQGITYSQLKNCAVLEKPFPELTDLMLISYKHDMPLISASFLGGFTPRLQSLELAGVQFPALGKLLLSATGLVTLHLTNIPNLEDILPDAMATYLSALTRLQKLFLYFQFPQSEDDRENRSLSLLARRFVVPSLTQFDFQGGSEYLGNLVGRIDTPVLDKFTIYFHQLSFNTPLLQDFFGRTNAFQALNRAVILIHPMYIHLALVQRKGMADHRTLDVHISCSSPDKQVLSLARFCSASLPRLPTLEHLGIHELTTLGPNWTDDDMENAPWLELLRSFATVKDLALSDFMVRSVVPALQELTGESVTEVLPALRHILVRGLDPSGPTQEAIAQFVTARQLSGHPVAVRALEIERS